MPAVIAIGAMYGLSGAAAAGAGIATAAAGAKVATDLYSAHKQAGAAEHAADLQSQAADKSLAFQEDQAKIDQANAEATRRANYEQWRAGQERLRPLDALVGLPERAIPDYVPLAAGAPPAPGTPGTPPPGRAVPRSAIQPMQAYAPPSPAPMSSPVAAQPLTPALPMPNTYAPGTLGYLMGY